MSPFVKETKFADRLAGYVEVKDRIALFYQAHPDGRLVTGEIRLTTEPDGKARVIVEALAYRTPEDTLPAHGSSWMELPGSTSYTRGSELENTETSAWGRAIGALGIGIKGGIASKEEVQGKASEAPSQAGIDGGMVGIPEVGKGDADFELRQTTTTLPSGDSRDGWILIFRLSEKAGSKAGIKVYARDDLAQLIDANRAAIKGQHATAWGSVMPESFEKMIAGKIKTITYSVLQLARIKVGTLDLSAPEHEPTEDEDALIDELGDLMDAPTPLHKPA